jgi:hypothetical protein
MVKFHSESDEHYQRVCAKIKEMIVNHKAELTEISFTSMETTISKAHERGEVQGRLQGGSSERSEHASD